MLGTNKVQKEYYESRFRALATRSKREEAANVATNVWTKLRRRMMRLGRDVGVEDYVLDLHRTWLGDLGDAAVLDLGCFSGNPLSLWIAERCGEYVGLDLSDQAIESLNAKLEERGLSHARGVCADVLANDFPDGKFDAVYAQGVLHHFQDLDVLLDELARLLKPGGVIVALDPMRISPENRLVRALFRPMQTDRAWEWPFKKRTFQTVRKRFEIAELQGYYGLVKLGFPLMMVPGLGRPGRSLAEWGQRFDQRNARRFGVSFTLCWKVAMKLRLKPA